MAYNKKKNGTSFRILRKHAPLQFNSFILYFKLTKMQGFCKISGHSPRPAFTPRGSC